LKASYITRGTTALNLGGLIGTLLTIPIATRLGRRPMYLGYFTLSAAAIVCTFGVALSPEIQLVTSLDLGDF
jgi:hypothetical protein